MNPVPLHLLAGGPGCAPTQLVRLLNTALEGVGGAGHPVAYVGAASGDNAGFQRRIGRLLAAAGAGPLQAAPSARGARDAPTARRVLAGAGVIFVSGGDVEAGMNALHAAGLVPDLRAAFARGAAFMGLSAGSIMLGQAWLAWEDPDDDTTVRSFACLGLAPLVCDTHAEADAWAELHALLPRLPDGTRAYAIPAPAMLRVDVTGRAAAFGAPIPVITRIDGACREELLALQLPR